VTRFVEGKLKLKVNRDKSAADRPWNRKFLGFSFLSNKQAVIRLAPKTIQRFKEKVREITDRTRPLTMEERLSTYPKTSAQRKQIQAQAKWSMAS